MNLADALPEPLRGLPRAVYDVDDAPAVARVLAAPKRARYRLADYACHSGHRLAEVLTVGERVLVLHGQDEWLRDPAIVDDPSLIFRRGMRFRAREGGSQVIRLAELAAWRDAQLRADERTAVRCRDGRHELSLWRVFDDLAAGTRRIVLPRSRTVF
ncbi:MAG TPA: hypothetical protein VK402_18125 [Blastococcus sp.]|nr:hypothetical protein [Blastococcus sp.]